MLSLDPQINYSVFAAISVRTHEVFSEHGIVYTLIYVFSRKIKDFVPWSRNQLYFIGFRKYLYCFNRNTIICKTDFQ